MSYLNLNIDYPPLLSAAVQCYRQYNTGHSEHCAVCMLRRAYVRPAECGLTSLVTPVTGNLLKDFPQFSLKAHCVFVAFSTNWLLIHFDTLKFQAL
jgi:hypothetical protein